MKPKGMGRGKKTDAAPRSGTTVQSVERALSLLSLTAAGPRPGRRLAELVASSGLSKPTVYRLMTVLARAGFVEIDEETRTYYPGMELSRLGAVAVERFGIVQLARPSLLRLAEATGDTVFLTVRVRNESICVDREIGPFPIKALTVEVGDRRPLGVGSGSLAILAFLGDAEIARMLDVNRDRLRGFPQMDPATFETLIAAARGSGHALVDGLLVEGMSGIGVPIFDGGGRPVAALSVAAMSSRLSGARRANVVSLLQAEARQVEQRMTPPGAPGEIAQGREYS